jgi:two-component system sensor histidine kinase DegS
MAFDLLLLTQMLEKEEQIAKATEISNAVQKTARHLRLVAQTLRPPVLAHLGLTAAVRAHIKQVQESREAPAISFAASEEVWSVPEETALALLRIMQQAVQNALQHANASHVEVRLHYDENWLCLEVQDDGQGLGKPYHRVEFARDGHLGIVGMAERAEAIRGVFEVESRASGGTCIRVTLPKIL